MKKSYLFILFLICSQPLLSQSLGLSPNAEHTIFLHSNGTVYTTGKNAQGQLGNSSTTSSNIPVRVLKGLYEGTTFLGDGSYKISKVAIGNYHSLALCEDGLIYAWGNNAVGEIGDSSTSLRSTPVRTYKGEYDGTTYLGDDNNKIITIGAGNISSMALTQNGEVYCWGYNAEGQLGNNTTTNSSYPVRVLKGEYDGTAYLGDNPANKIIDIATGGRTSIALDQNGTVYAWGYNGYGQLGDNTTSRKLTPIRVLKGEYNGTIYLGDNAENIVIDIAVGNNHCIALMEDGTAFTWGQNNYGQLGAWNTTDKHTPVRVNKGSYYSGTTYLGDNTNNKIIKIALGNDHSMALMENGTVYTWGGNVWGQIGNNGTSNYGYKLPFKVYKGEYDGTTYLGDNLSNKIIDIAGGRMMSVALSDENLVYTWGYNAWGQLGNNSNDAEHTPVIVSDIYGTGDLTVPITLETLSSQYQEGNVHLSWQTESETENLGFILERCVAADDNWTEIASYMNNEELLGHGSTTESHSYQYIDNTVKPGLSYTYRLGDVNYCNNILWHDEIRITTDPQETKTPIEFRLKKVYPSPFNPSTMIEYEIPINSDVKIDVFDINGKMVKNLVDEYTSKGYYKTEFNGSELSSGVYYIKLQANNYSDCKKVLLLK